MKKVLDNFEDISVESSIVVLTDFSSVGAGIIIGLSMAIFFGWASYKISFIDSLLEGYEYISYDSRMRSRTADVEQMSIEDVVVIDIDNTSVGPVEEGGLGRYHNWPHAYHGQLINTVTSGNPKALLLILFLMRKTRLNMILCRLFRQTIHRKIRTLNM